MASLAHLDLKNPISSSEETSFSSELQVFFKDEPIGWGGLDSTFIDCLWFCYKYYDIKKFVFFILLFKAHYFVNIFYMRKIIF